MNTRKKAQLVVAIFGALLVLIGAAYILQLNNILAIGGVFHLDASAQTDARATYGGIQVGLGIYLLLVLRRDADPYERLLLLSVSLAVVGATRLFGYWYDSPTSGLHFLLALGELTIAAFFTGFARRLRMLRA